MPTPSVISASGTVALGDCTIHRLGFGAMQVTGPGVWGQPRNPSECQRVLTRAIDLGVDFIDTADSYGPYISEELIREALHPYPKGLVIATKAGTMLRRSFRIIDGFSREQTQYGYGRQPRRLKDRSSGD